jgi:uncharacterized integral membrane protein
VLRLNETGGVVVNDDSKAKTGRDRRRSVGRVLMTLAAVLLLWFVIGNSQKVEIHFWVVSAHSSLITVIVISAALGAALALLMVRSRRRSGS